MSTHSILPQVSSGTFAHARHSLRDLLQQALQATYATLLLWNDRQTQRHHLHELDDRLLRDMGLSRQQVRHEALKPFWRG